MQGKTEIYWHDMTIGTERLNKLVKSCRKEKDLLSELEFRVRGKSIDEITSRVTLTSKQWQNRKKNQVQKKSCHFQEEQRRGADLQEMADRPVDGEVKRIDQKPFFYVTLDSRRPWVCKTWKKRGGEVVQTDYYVNQVPAWWYPASETGVVPAKGRPCPAA